MRGDIDRLLYGAPKRVEDEGEAVTGKVVRVTGGLYVVPLEGDERDPIGPCRGPEVEVGDVVLLVWTSNDRPWVAQVDTQPEI